MTTTQVLELTFSQDHPPVTPGSSSLELPVPPQTSRNWKTPEFKNCDRMRLAYERCNELTQYPSVIGGQAR